MRAYRVMAVMMVMALTACGGQQATTGVVTATAAPAAATATAETPQPVPDADELLEQAVAAGSISQEEALVGYLKALAGEAPLPEILRGETAHYEANGIIAMGAHYTREGSDEAVKVELTRLLDELFPSEDQLLEISLPEAQGRGKANGAANVRLLPGCGEGFCLSYREFNAGGFQYRIFYPRQAPALGRWWEPYLDAAAEALQASAARYSAVAPVGPVNLVFNPAIGEERPRVYASMPFDWYRRGEGCPVMIWSYTARARISVDDFRQVVAHEIFHCVQAHNYFAQSMGIYSQGSKWWVEGIAEYYSQQAYPGVNFEMNAMVPNFATGLRTQTPLTRMAYENVIFFNYMAGEVRDAGMHRFMSGMPAVAGEETQIAGASHFTGMQDIFHRFARAYFQGAIAGIDPLVTDEAVNGVFSRSLEVLPFTLTGLRLTFQQNRGFNNTLLNDGGPGRSSALPQGGEWGALPAPLGKECLPRTHLLVVSTAGTTRHALLLNAAPAEVGECSNACLVGSWFADGQEILRPVLLAFPPPPPPPPPQPGTGEIWLTPVPPTTGGAYFYFGEDGTYKARFSLSGSITSGLEGMPLSVTIKSTIAGGGQSTYAVTSPGVVKVNSARPGDWNVTVDNQFSLSDGTVLPGAGAQSVTSPDGVSSSGGTAAFSCTNAGLYYTPQPAAGVPANTYHLTPAVFPD